MLAPLAKIPGALMIVPLLVGAVLNTVDQMHLSPIQTALKAIGAPAVVDLKHAEPLLDPRTGKPVINPVTGEAVKDPRTGRVYYEFLNLGGFTSALAKSGALTLIAMFLVCVGSQMNLSVGRRALKKGVIITLAKLVTAAIVGYALAALSDPFVGWLGLSLVAVVAAMSNGNGGLYVALTAEYGNRSDVGAVSVISLNDGPFFTLLALGMMGEKFPVAVFLAVLIPMAVGFALGRASEQARAFLKHGERLTIPFFAFALGTTMTFATFLNLSVLSGGLVLGFLTVLLTGGVSVFCLRLLGERSQIAGFAEASTAGNAVQTPLAVATAASGAAATGMMAADRAAEYQSIVSTATAQVSVSTLTTALLCPIAVLFWDRYQRRRGVDARKEAADTADSLASAFDSSDQPPGNKKP